MLNKDTQVACLNCKLSYYVKDSGKLNAIIRAKCPSCEVVSGYYRVEINGWNPVGEDSWQKYREYREQQDRDIFKGIQPKVKLLYVHRKYHCSDKCPYFSETFGGKKYYSQRGLCQVTGDERITGVQVDSDDGKRYVHTDADWCKPARIDFAKKAAYRFPEYQGLRDVSMEEEPPEDEDWDEDNGEMTEWEIRASKVASS